MVKTEQTEIVNRLGGGHPTIRPVVYLWLDIEAIYKLNINWAFSLFLSSSRVSCSQCDQKKIAKRLEKLPKSDFTRKMNYFTPLQKLPKNVGDLGKSIVTKGFKKMPKVQ